MNTNSRMFLLLAALVCFVFSFQGYSKAESPAQKNVLLRFHSFPLNPGEKVVGAHVTVSNGHIVQTLIPRGWIHTYDRTTTGKHIVHCSSTHSSHAISASGKMPVISIAVSSGKQLSIEASVEIEGVDGKTYTRQMHESELSVQ